MNNAVLFVFYNPLNRKVLSEKRPVDHHTFPNMITFPTGSVDDGETIEEALVREAMEEFGIVPTVYESLPPLEGNKTMLHPFWIKEWKGKLPEIVLDKGSKLIWESLDEAAASSIASRKKVIDVLRTRIGND